MTSSAKYIFLAKYASHENVKLNLTFVKANIALRTAVQNLELVFISRQQLLIETFR